MKNNKQILFILLIFALLFTIRNIYFFSGYFGYDDVEYSKLALDILTEKFSLTENPFAYRWTTIFSTAIAYSLFGINDFARGFPPILTSFLILAATLIFTHKKSKTVQILAIVLTGTSIWFFYYSDKIMPDIYVALFYFLSIAIIYHFKFVKKYHILLYSLGLSISLFLGFISKGTILLLLPVLLSLFIIDLVKKQNLKFWVYTTSFSALLLLIYFYFIKIETGDFFTRFILIDKNSYINPCSYDKLPVINTIKRISYELLYNFIQNGLFTLIVLSLPLLSIQKFKNIFKNDENSFILLITVISLLSANFMSISIKSYIPMCIDIRHYLFLFPVLSISAAIGVERVILNKKKYTLLIFTLLVISAFSYFGAWYFDTLLLFILFSIIKIFMINSKTSIKLIIIGLFISTLLFTYKNYDFLWEINKTNIIEIHKLNKTHLSLL